MEGLLLLFSFERFGLAAAQAKLVIKVAKNIKTTIKPRIKNKNFLFAGTIED